MKSIVGVRLYFLSVKGLAQSACGFVIIINAFQTGFNRLWPMEERLDYEMNKKKNATSIISNFNSLATN
jgi:hypothetical protein